MLTVQFERSDIEVSQSNSIQTGAYFNGRIVNKTYAYFTRFVLHYQQLFLMITWWRHQMETFSALLAICVGNSPVTGEFPSQRPVTRSFDVFFDLRLNEWLSKQSWG